MRGMLFAMGLLAVSTGCARYEPPGVLRFSSRPDASVAARDAGPLGNLTAELGELVEQPTAPPPISGGTLLALRDGRTYVAADPDRDRLWIVDLVDRTSRFVALSAGDEPGRAAEGDDGVVYVALRRGGAVVTLNVARGELSARRALCVAPRGLAWDVARRELVVACAGGELVSVPEAGEPRVSRLDDDLRDVVIWNERRFVTRFRSAELLEVSPEGALLHRTAPPSMRDGTGSAQRLPGVAWRTVAHPTLGLVMLHQLSSTAPIVLDPVGDGGVRAGAYGRAGGSCAPTTVSSVITTFQGSAVMAANMLLPGAILAVDLAVHGTDFAVVTPGNNVQRLLGLTYRVSSSARLSCLTTRSLGATERGEQAVAAAFTPEGRVVLQRRDEAGLSVLGGAAFRVPFAEAPSVRDTGHAIFHSGTATAMACASCHPEGGDDGRVWTFTELGMRRTPPLRGATSDTAPFHWDGDMTDLSHLLSDVLALRMGAGALSAAQQQALSHWIDGVPALHIRAPADAETLARGRAIFEGVAGCADCHSGPAFTNNESEDVGTGGRFQVPQLRGLAARAPYLHDGRAATLDHRLMMNDGDRHGRTSGLSPTQRADLIRYLESL